MRLKDRVAVVTGAAQGIGRAIAVRFAAEGCRVVIADRNAARLAEAAAAIGDACASVAVDLTDDDAPTRVIQTATERFGRLDILVNNAGVATVGFVDGATDGEYNRVMDINVRAVLRMIQAAVEPLYESDGARIINLASVEGVRGSGLLPIYCASKHAVVGLTRATAIELGRAGITVNCICPGPIETEMLAPLIHNKARREKVIASVPVKRLGTPADVAGAALFLASDDASFVNGHALVVDGGLIVNA